MIFICFLFSVFNGIAADEKCDFRFVDILLEYLANTWSEDTHESGRDKKMRPGEVLMQLGVPAAMMPAILMGTVLPFILPALKFATIISGIINHAALLSAIIYAAKSSVSASDPAPNPVYYNDQYQRRSTISYI